MKNILLLALLILAGAMIYLGLTAKILPPTLTGLGFIVIAGLFYNKNN